MTNPIGADFARVSEFLLEPAADVPSNETVWETCGSARARSAASRAYYAAFLVIKSQLVVQRADWRRDYRTFPKREVHKKLREALSTVLGEEHRIVINMRSLLRQRRQADYEEHRSFDLADADAPVDAGWEVLELIPNVSSEQWRRMADELYDLDRVR